MSERRVLGPDFFPSCEAHALPIRSGEKWAWKIMRCLEDGPRRFSELKVPLRGITPKVLAETLRAMERDGILERRAYEENPPRVEYGLTPLGRSLFGPIDAACEWTRANLDRLLAARALYLDGEQETGGEQEAGGAQGADMEQGRDGAQRVAAS